MSDTLLDDGSISFQAHSRLLQELGLRLVASPEVALVELIKNAYDADSDQCLVRLAENEAALIVEDDGHGMSLDDFKTKWMQIATPSKLPREVSAKYRRKLTGAKGIGRFAVRFLGEHLTLESVAYDRARNCKTRLTAEFDWRKLDESKDLSKTAVKYKLTSVSDDTSSGTILTIRQLRDTIDFIRSAKLRENVLRIVSPIQGLDPGRFASSNASTDNDPGFSIILPGEDAEQDVDMAKFVLNNYWARLAINLNRKTLEFHVWFRGARKPKKLKVRVRTNVAKGFCADIRFFPRRKGVFKEKGIDGRKAWEWVRENCGVAVVDHGFRIKPYGYRDDDWLRLDLDKAHKERDWQTVIANEYFPIPPAARKAPAENPMLNLPYNLQLIGAVFIESKRLPKPEEERDLVPAMDREGLLHNTGFAELREFVRAGIEFLAHEDKAELDRRAELEAKEIAKRSREEIRKAIEYIAQSPTLTASDKGRIVKQYSRLAERVDEQEEYSAQSRRSLTTMSLLGVVAGFMTHESKAIVHELEQALSQINALVVKHPELRKTAEDLLQRVESFRGYLDYARVFIRNVRATSDKPLSAAGQVRYILNRFKGFADDRRIEIANDVPCDVMTPPLPVTVYSGVLLNLYTNALKAVLTGQSSVRHPRISFRAWNEPGMHIVEVVDNGVGIPLELRKRIWEPLFTTTSDIGNPLGSGMGLGLPLIKQVVSDFGGSVSLEPTAPPGFVTCFRVKYPQK